MNLEHPKAPPVHAPLRDIATDAIGYWEPRRLVYNGALAAVFIGYFCTGLPDSRTVLTPNGILSVLVLAVLANLCYCAAYVADLFAQFSGFREVWLRRRWLLLAIGIVFAAVLTRFFALGLFTPPFID